MTIAYVVIGVGAGVVLGIFLAVASILLEGNGNGLGTRVPTRRH